MKVALCVAMSVGLITGLSSVVKSQSPSIQHIIDQVDSVELRNTVEVLSGERTLPSDTSRIVGRRSAAGRALARTFLLDRLHAYGLNAWPDSFVSGSISNKLGANIIAQQPGRRDSTVKVVICAHFDDSETNGVGPGADDNASGCATVLEAARILSKETLPFTVVYAFWDLEEDGKVGSSYYAKWARNRADSILGVLNLDMMGWDGDNDQVGEVHVLRWIANSGSLADSILRLSQDYQTGVTVHSDSADLYGSDHKAFYYYGYSAVLLTEEATGGDLNPYYDTVNDRISHFNFRTFLGLSRLAVASIAWMAGASGTSSTDVPESKLPSQFMLPQNYPNPFNPSTTIKYELPRPTHVSLRVYDVLGREVSVLVNDWREAGVYEAKFDGNRLSSGVYFYRLQAGDFVQSKKLVLLR